MSYGQHKRAPLLRGRNRASRMKSFKSKEAAENYAKELGVKEYSIEERPFSAGKWRVVVKN